MPRLFALDHNFPDPIVSVLGRFQADAELVRVDEIDPRLPDLADWELLLALHHDERPWDGLITSSMLRQPRELATLLQTRLTLVVAMEAGHNPVKASGLLFAHLAGICRRTDDSRAQVWRLQAVARPHTDPWDLLRGYAEHNNRAVDDVWREAQLAADELMWNPLAAEAHG